MTATSNRAVKRTVRVRPSQVEAARGLLALVGVEAVHPVVRRIAELTYAGDETHTNVSPERGGSETKV